MFTINLAFTSEIDMAFVQYQKSEEMYQFDQGLSNIHNLKEACI